MPPDFRTLFRQPASTVAGLPHPKAFEVLDFAGYVQSVIGENGLRLARSVLSDPSHTKGESIALAVHAFPSLRPLIELSNSSTGRLDVGTLEWLLAPLRFQALGGRIMSVDPELNERLLATDIGSKAPCQFFRLPYRSIYIDFGPKGAGIDIWGIDGSPMPLMGAYLNEIPLSPTAEPAEKALLERLFPSSDQLTCYEITLVAPPVGEAAQYNFMFFRLYLAPEVADSSIEEVLTAQMKAYTESGISRSRPEDDAPFIASMEHLTKVLLYINSEQSLLQQVRDASELREQIERRGAKKAAKLTRRLARAYDYVLVTSADPFAAAAEGAGGHRANGVRPHWRRGHFRVQPHGPKRALSKLIWIAPQQIRADRVGGGAPKKDYRIR